METIEDIVREMRKDIPRVIDAKVILRNYADRFEAALKRKTDNIHRAMVLIAGIEMEDSDDPPRLWTALEDAYDALSDALGTDGETTADVEEAKAIGRHFVVKPSGRAAKMREALKHIESLTREFNVGNFYRSDYTKNVLDIVSAALSTPPRKEEAK